MEREIRFRAYHRKLKKMLEVYVIHQQLKSGVKYMSLCKGYWGDNQQVSFAFDEVDWLQFTGLKDKNGTHIYEGDILDYAAPAKDLQLTVIFMEGAFGFMSGDFCSFSENKEQINKKGIEVIGNVYENPESL